MVKTSSYDRNGVKKGLWSREEDEKLKAYIQRYGHWNWNELPRFAGLSRCGKSCRLRWMNYLQPNVRRGNYTQEEDELIIKLQEELGNKWCIIASKLPGRTDNEVKNHWHSKLNKRMRNSKTSEEDRDQSSRTSKCEANRTKWKLKTVLVNDVSFKILESSQATLEASSSKTSSISSDHVLSSGAKLAAGDSVASSNMLSEFSSDFWAQLLADNSQVSLEASSSEISSIISDHALSSGANFATVDSVASSNMLSEFSNNFWTERPFLAHSYQNDFPSALGEGGFSYPYISYGDDVVDLLY